MYFLPYLHFKYTICQSKRNKCPCGMVYGMMCIMFKIKKDVEAIFIEICHFIIIKRQMQNNRKFPNDS